MRLRVKRSGVVKNLLGRKARFEFLKPAVVIVSDEPRP